MVRMGEALHSQLAQTAKEQHISLNQVCLRFLENGLNPSKEEALWRSAALSLIVPLKKKFGKSLLGVAAFGSQVQGTATPSSDLDLLVILDNSVAIKRELYVGWDELAQWSGPIKVVNPHFVHLPADAAEAGGLWLEVALHHDILFEQGKKVSAMLAAILAFIREGKIVRLFSNGHPYWVKEAS